MSGSNGSRPDSEALEREFRAVQERYPKAPLLAMESNGLTAAMPVSVPRKENPALTGRSGLDSIPSEEHGVLIEAFERVLSEGKAECLLHPPSYGEVTWYGFDLRERHGVIVALIGTDREPDATGEASDQREMVRVGPPRFATIRKDERSFIIGVSGAIPELLGWQAEEMVGRRTLDFVHPDDHALAVDNWIELLANPGPGRRVRQRLLHRDGSWVWFEVTNHNLFNDPEHGCVVGEMVDISDEMAAEEALRAREQLLHRLAETVPVGLLLTDGEGAIVYTNDRLHEIVGVERAAHVHEQLTKIDPGNRPRLEGAVEEVLRDGSDSDIEVAFVRDGGEDMRFCTVSFRALRRDDGTVSGAIACVVDVTEGTRMREELKFRATFDELTGCHNRASIMAALEADIARDSASAERAVLYADLDAFKSVNDRHGHAAGDEQLRKVAALLRKSVRDRDLVGRMGGDEFLVICSDVGGPDQANKLAERLEQVLHDGLAPTAGAITCTVSMGVAWSRGDSMTADALVAAADEAMYERKRARRRQPKAA